MKVVIVSHDKEHPGQVMLRRSLNAHGWEYVEICEPYRGFGYKINELAKYLRESGDERFIFQDAFDTYCLLPESDIPWPYANFEGVVVSGEKQCWPDPNRAHYFNASSPWRYPNSGQVYGTSREFLALVDRYPIRDEEDDQRWYTDRAIAGEVLVDDECNLFQSIAFEQPGDFEYVPNIPKYRLKNNRTGTFPLFAHGNGRTDMNKIYTL